MISLSLATAYCSKPNIVVPANEPKSAATLATEASTRVRETETLVSAATLTTPVKSPT